MKRSTRLMVVATIAVLTVFAAAATAFARTGASGTNAQCATCHSVQARAGAPLADFRSPVDYTRCPSCHWISSRTRSGAYYTHRHGAGSACSSCHAGYSAGPAYTMAVRTAAGYFTDASYASRTAAEMHAIHARGSWPQSTALPAACASCHAPATCDSCHAVPATHSGHAYNSTNRAATYAPVSARATRGTPVNNASISTARVTPQTCVNSNCHVVGADGSTVTRRDCTSCHVPTQVAAIRAVPAKPVKKVRVR